MKFLIFTQKVDINDDLLGFFHIWLEKMAEKVAQISVIALYVGQYNLPDNVKIFSLGKENLEFGIWNLGFVKKLKYIFNFFSYIWKLRKEHDVVFVHMNIEYVFLGALWWRLMRKKIVLWYAHYRIDWRAKLAFLLSHRIVTSTANACKIKNRKLKVIGQGIDLNKFKVQSSKFKVKEEFHILYLGRISKIKNLDLLIRAFSKLSVKYSNLFLDIVGAPTPVDEDYFEYIQNLVRDLGIESKVKFFGKIPNYKTVEFYNRADLYVNLTRTGSFDKTSLEAMACETSTLTCNKAFYEYFDEDLQRKMIFEEGDQEDLIQRIEEFLNLSDEEQKQIGAKQREIIKKYHSLDNLVDNLIVSFRA